MNISELKYSRGSGKYQCPGCHKWFEFEYFIEHHIQYEPVEITRFLCRKCHSAIHKTGLRNERKEFLKNKREAREAEREARRIEYLKHENAFRLLLKKGMVISREEGSKRGWNGGGWGVKP